MAFTVQTGDFCCIPISGEVGKLIELGQWLDGDGFSDYDHSEIYVGYATYPNAPFGYTIGAYPGGAAMKPLPCAPQLLPQSIWSSQADFGLTNQSRAAIVSWANSCIGTPYSSLDYAALVTHRLHIPVPGLREYIATSDHMICSQLVDYVYMKAGVNLFTDNRWPGYVTPGDLANLIRSKTT